MRSIAAIFLSLNLCGCGGVISAADRGDADAIVAILDAEYQVKQTSVPNLPDTLGPSRTEDAREPEKVAPVVHRRVVVVTAPAWCAPCRKLEPHLSNLKSRGWRVHSGDDAQIQVLNWDVSSERQEAFRIGGQGQWVLPTIMVVVDGQVESRNAGVLTAFQIGDLYTGK